MKTSKITILSALVFTAACGIIWYYYGWKLALCLWLIQAVNSIEQKANMRRK